MTNALPRAPYSDLSIFQKIGVAGPSSTPDSDFRHALRINVVVNDEEWRDFTPLYVAIMIGGVGAAVLKLSRVAQLDQRTALPDQCLPSAEADVRPQTGAVEKVFLHRLTQILRAVGAAIL